MSTASQTLSPALVAVITAAVHAAIEAPAQILSIRPATAGQAGGPSSWALEGRRAIFASHRLR